MVRGRPQIVNTEILINEILNHRDEIVNSESESGLVTEKHAVWQAISKILDNKIKPSSLYAYVVKNKYDLKTLIVGKPVSENPSEYAASNSSISDSSDDFNFVLTFAKSEFSGLVLQSVRQYTDKNNFKRSRYVNIMHPQKWTEVVSKKIFNEFRLPHGYHFKTSYLEQDCSGGFTGNNNLKTYLNSKRFIF